MALRDAVASLIHRLPAETVYKDGATDYSPDGLLDAVVEAGEDGRDYAVVESTIVEAREGTLASVTAYKVKA
jgi:hypothetical protein